MLRLALEQQLPYWHRLLFSQPGRCSTLARRPKSTVESKRPTKDSSKDNKRAAPQPDQSGKLSDDTGKKEGVKPILKENMSGISDTDLDEPNVKAEGGDRKLYEAQEGGKLK
ncbi:hypothetical protein Ddc_16135 [Ditylenchus destructor]|nr:hypothetical protein Ddc_16135 [Ditylenchus destructor]